MGAEGAPAPQIANCSKHQKHYPRRLSCGEHMTRRGDLAVWLDQAAAASALGAPCLGVLSLVRDTVGVNSCTKLFHQAVHALSARSCKTRRYTNVVCCFLKIPPSA